MTSWHWTWFNNSEDTQACRSENQNAFKLIGGKKPTMANNTVNTELSFFNFGKEQPKIVRTTWRNFRIETSKWVDRRWTTAQTPRSTPRRTKKLDCSPLWKLIGRFRKRLSLQRRPHGPTSFSCLWKSYKVSIWQGFEAKYRSNTGQNLSVENRLVYWRSRPWINNFDNICLSGYWQIRIYKKPGED